MLTKKQKQQSAMILDQIYANGPIARVELSRKLGITPATMTEITHYLLDRKVIYEIGEDTDDYHVGRKKILLDITPQYAYFLGIEFYHNFFSMCITDNKGTVFAQQVVEFSPEELNVNFTWTRILNTLASFREQHAQFTLTSIGFSLPGFLDSENKVLVTDHPFWNSLNLTDFENAVDLPVYFAPLTNSLAIAQRIFSTETALDDFIFLHIRNKIVTAYMKDGQLVENQTPYVAELGHTTSNPQGEVCSCGKRGCLHTYSSEEAILRKSKMIYEVSANSFFHNIVKDQSQIDMNAFIKAYRLGDDATMTIIKNAMKYLAITLENLTMMIDINHIYVHGTLFNTPEFTDILNNSLAENSSPYRKLHRLNYTLVPYKQINGAISACAHSVRETIIHGF
ncbi:ROK family transcriptional regulator [Fundicoccus sp. Sow4_D5]|uniref:ROK family transcriptional regulator n=1 Tax=Fundicoccus sp. Sow4_D5 TaxID=3438782 RepID=UPI003F92BCF1